MTRRRRKGPGRPKGKSQKSRDTELRILYAAADCIAEIGVEKATLRAIARYAGVSPALVSHYFPKKDAVLERVIRQIMRLAYESIEATPPAGAPPGPETVARQFVRTNLEFFLKNPSFYKCFILFYHFASIQPRMKELNGEATARAMARLETVLDPRTARILHGYVVAAILKYYVVPQTHDTEAYARMVEDDAIRLLANER